MEDGTFLCLCRPVTDERSSRLDRLAAEMAANGSGRDDPARAVFALVGDRWSMLILLVLGLGRWRHAELRRVLGDLASEGRISQRVLTEKLRALRRNGFVSREATLDVPPRVSYELTALGQQLLERSRRLLDWIQSERPAIDAARAVFARDENV